MRRSGKVLVVGAVVLVAAATVAVREASGGPPQLAPVSADRLAAEAAAALAADPSISGTLNIHVDLGIPTLGDPDLPGAGAFGLLGDHTVRVWRSPFGLRLALVGSSTEQDLYVGKDGAWAWDFSTLSATRLAAPGVRTGLFPLDILVSPADFRGLLDGLRPSARVAVGAGVRVAGRAAYPLTLEPKDPGTLVGRVEIDVDAEHRVPLALRVFPRDSSRPAIEVAFTSVGFGSVDVHRFDFAPPAGAQVDRSGANVDPLAIVAGLGLGAGGRLPGIDEVRTLGQGWSGAVAIRFPPNASSTLDQLTRFLPLSGPLLSARAAVDRHNRFWIVLGPVTQTRLGLLARDL